jgi:hypothetical protein
MMGANVLLPLTHPTTTTYCPKAVETITVIVAIAIRIKESGIIIRILIKGTCILIGPLLALAGLFHIPVYPIDILTQFLKLCQDLLSLGRGKVVVGWGHGADSKAG